MAPYTAPGRLIKKVLNPLIQATGTVPVLTVRGRRSGELKRVVVWVLEQDGERYLVAPRGDTHWARNLRASGEGHLRAGRNSFAFKAEELTGPRRAELVEEYKRRWGNQVKGQFEALPDPADHPTFRLIPAQREQPPSSGDSDTAPSGGWLRAQAQRWRR